MSFEDTIEIKSTLKILRSPQFQCSVCIAHPLSEKSRLQKGCKEIRSFPVPVIHDDGFSLEYYTCLGNFYSHSAVHYIRMFEMYDKGVLPFPGSLSDQPQKILDLFKLVSIDRERYLKAEQEKSRLKNRGGRGR